MMKRMGIILFVRSVIVCCVNLVEEELISVLSAVVRVEVWRRIALVLKVFMRFLRGIVCNVEKGVKGVKINRIIAFSVRRKEKMSLNVLVF